MDNNNTLVYRIETLDGEGLYSTGDNEVNDILEFDSVRHPLPHEDNKLKHHVKFNRNWYFGFETIDLLKKWTISNECRDKLEACGLQISVYECYHEDMKMLYMVRDKVCSSRDIQLKLMK